MLIQALGRTRSVIFCSLLVLLASCGGGGSSSSGSNPGAVNNDGSSPDAPGGTGTSPGNTDSGGFTPPDTVADSSLYPARGDPRVGSMSAVGQWPLVPLHTVLTSDARVLTYGRDPDDASVMIYDIWDWSGGLGADSHMTLPNRVGTDLFCSNMNLLQSGELLMTGGDQRPTASAASIGGQANLGNSDATVFDPKTNQLSRRGSMNESRWYATMTKLMNGELYVQGGAVDANTNEPAKHVEVGSPDGSNWRLINSFQVGDLNWYYPRNFLTRSGDIIGWAHNTNFRIDPRGAGSRTDIGSVPQVVLNNGSTAVMFAPGKILLAGGGNERAMRADINGPFPAYESVPDMTSPRLWSTGTVLPDGKVLISNGGDSDTSILGAPLGNPAQYVDIYDPVANTFTRGPSSQFARLYHSASMLLPDATVLIGGGGLPGPVTNTNAEVYFPPYLFKADGSLAPRPTIARAPSVLNVGAAFTLDSPQAASIARVVLVKTGAATHSFDMDQRFVELQFTRQDETLTASMPAHPGDTPPGFYHIFVLDQAGVPSVSKIARMNVYTGALPPVPASGPALTMVGGQQGDRRELSCGLNEVLIGIHGRAYDRLYRLGPVCAEVAADGSWTNRVIDRPVSGDLFNDSVDPSLGVFRGTCPANSAVSGFAGAADPTGRYVGRIELNCQTLAGVGAVTGPAVAGPAVGAATATSVQTCPNGKPAIGVTGMSNYDGYFGFSLRCGG